MSARAASDGAAAPATGHLVTLDAMRGLAALAVVAFHVHGLLAPIDFGHAYLAVDLFFGLSGLVIARAYGARFDAGLTPVVFMRMRVVRLYPLYALGTLLGVLLVMLALRWGNMPPIDPTALTLALVAAALMLPAPLPIEAIGRLAPFNVAAWSLVFEMGANALLVLTWRRLTPRRLALVIGLSGLLLALGAWRHGDADVGVQWSNAALAVPRTLFSFCIGIALARHAPALRPRHGYDWPILILLTLVFALPRAIHAPAYDLACIAVVFPLLIWIGAATTPRHAGLARWLGLISYPIYAVHTPLLVLASLVLKRLPALAQAPYVGIAFLIAACLVADFAARRLDPALRRYLDRLLPRVTRPTPALVVQEGPA
jgi:peptidoglycan/LPS O-acetylase OafA/YrhL